jgi:hypothetical protein
VAAIAVTPTEASATAATRRRKGNFMVTSRQWA